MSSKSSHSFQVVKNVFNWKGTKIPDDTADWYGNDTLHNLVISNEPNALILIKGKLRKHNNSYFKPVLNTSPLPDTNLRSAFS